MQISESSAKLNSFMGRVMDSITLPSFRWQSTSPACGNPQCPRRSHRHTFARRLDGVQIAGQWYCSPPCCEAGLEHHVSGLIMESRRLKATRKARVPLGLMLLSRGKVTQDQLSFALTEHRFTGVRLGDVLLQHNFVREDEVAAALAAQWGCPVFPSNAAVELLPVRLPRRLMELHRMMPLHFARPTRRLLLGFADGVDHRIVATTQQTLDCLVDPCFITMSEFRRRLSFFRPENRLREAVFDRLCDSAEIARVSRSYIGQLGASRANFAVCGNNLWARVFGNKHEMDLVFRFQAP
jgi:Type II secretion system (T2SS), protein E, N-terminal domain